jgi:hypothetical protein
MDVQDLKNFGEAFTGKASARVMMASFTSIPRELGFIGTPKFVAKLQSKERHWKRKRFRTIAENGLKNEELIQGIRYSLAFYTALLASCGEEKTLKSYPKLAKKLSVMMYEDFFPSPEDFLSCSDPWEGFRKYFLEFFRAWERDGACRFEVIHDTEDEFQVHLSYCAFEAMHREAGCLEAIAMGAEGDVDFLPRLGRGVGCEFRREGWLCHSDPVCDWHFLRHKPSVGD